MALIAYARVSTRDQKSASQVAELEAAGCERVFVDHGESSRIPDRPEWTACLNYLLHGDVLVFTEMTRIAGGLHDDAGHAGAASGSGDQDQVADRTGVRRHNPTGRLHGANARCVYIQFRLDAIRENTMRGLKYARSQGRVGGRPTVMTPERTEPAVKMAEEGAPVTRIARVLGVGASSVMRALKRHQELEEPAA